MAAGIKRVSFRDIDFQMRTHPQTGALVVLEGDEAVKQGVKLTVMTDRFERPFRPLFGGSVRQRLFSPHVSFTEQQIRKDIEYAVNNDEPRAELLTVQIRGDANQKAVSATVKFRTRTSVEAVETDVIVKRPR